MRIIKVGYTYSRSIKVADYKYYKPAVYVEAMIDEDEDLQEATAALKGYARVEMQTLIDEEKEHYNKQLQKAQLERVMRENRPDSTEHILAKEKLEKFQAGELE